MAEAPPPVRTVVRDGILVSGPDATSWLQGQVSQDLETLAPGETRLTLVLSPQGKIDSFCRVTRLDGDRLLLDVERGFGEALLERLRRFKIRVKATLEAVVVRCEERAGAGLDSFGPPEVVPESDAAALAGSDADPAVEAVFEAARIIAKIPRLGRELTERTIPQEVGDEFVARTVSFTKGCYTGQELVARLDSRGSNVPRRLRVLRSVGTPAVDPAPGDRIERDGADAGELVSVARDGAGDVVALGYVKRAHLSDEPSEGDVVTGGERVRVSIAPPAPPAPQEPPPESRRG
jgi:folate-binding protein YgfZ